MTEKIAKQFLKWAGGKTQLINEIEKSLPFEITSKKFTYIEPFVGSGAIMFWMINNFPNLEKAVINDINSDLINTCFDDIYLGVPCGRAFRSNLLFVPHKRIFITIPNAKLAA